MILELVPINSDATVNKFHNVGSIQFVPGFATNLLFQLTQASGQRYIPDPGVTFSTELQLSDGSTINKTPALKFPTDDRSIVEIELTDLETETLISQNMIINVIEGAIIIPAVRQMAIQSKKILGC